MRAFADLMANVPETARGQLVKLVADFDHQALKSFVRFAEHMDGKTLGTFIEFVCTNFKSKAAAGLSKAGCPKR